MSDAAGPTAGVPRDRWWRGLAARCTIAVGAMLGGFALVLTVTVGLNVRHNQTDELERRLAADADRVAAALAEGAFSPARFADIASSLEENYAYLATPDGAVIAGAATTTAAHPAVPDNLLYGEGGGPGLAVVSTGGGYAHASKALTLSDGRVAVVRLGRSLQDANAAVQGAVATALLATLAFLALALPVAAVLIDQAAAPLRALTRAVTRPGSARAEVERAGDRMDEIGALARAHMSIARNLADNADELHRLTYDDPLTRLPNRGSLTSRLATTLQIGRPVALIEIEIDGLTRVEVGLGHRHGDDAILIAADRLRKASAEWAAAAPPVRRKRDAETSVMLARISDSGFAFLAFGTDADGADDLARRAVEAFDAPLKLDEHEIALSVVVGVAIGPDDGDEAGALLRSAAAALSAAQAAGARSVRTAGADLNQRAYGRLRTEQDLRRAIDQDELEVHFQPQIALRQGVVSGAEALVRWRHPTRGLVPPGDFVAIAEECGLVEPLGRFVLAEACRQCAAWTSMGMVLRIAVNVSTVQFRHPRFAETTLEIIRASGADPSSIELEITESAAMGDPEHAARELAPLKAAGVRIAIDDFGTGYSNLATLTQLPFDVLKIDRGFVRDALVQPAARVVVGTVIGMAYNLDYETVAEGVETAEQLEFVTAHGCTYAQGYLFGRPMAAPAFEAWYAERLVAELRAIGVRNAPAAGGWTAEPRITG